MKVSMGEGKVLITPVARNDKKVGRIYFQCGKGCGVIGRESVEAYKRFNPDTAEVCLEFKNVESLESLMRAVVDLMQIMNGTTGTIVDDKVNWDK